MVLLVARGMSNKSIAHQLGISPRTVEGHLNHVFDKLGVLSRTELVHYALATGGFVATAPPIRPPVPAWRRRTTAPSRPHDADDRSGDDVHRSRRPAHPAVGWGRWNGRWNGRSVGRSVGSGAAVRRVPRGPRFRPAPVDRLAVLAPPAGRAGPRPGTAGRHRGVRPGSGGDGPRGVDGRALRRAGGGGQRSTTACRAAWPPSAGSSLLCIPRHGRRPPTSRTRPTLWGEVLQLVVLLALALLIGTPGVGRDQVA